jgi:hypothetical protein
MGNMQTSLGAFAVQSLWSNANDGCVLSTPLFSDGTFIQDTSTGNVYRITGGAPVYVSSWVPFGGPKPTILIGPNQLASLPKTPADGTFIQGAQTGQVYRIAGGAPIYVSTWSAFGGAQPTVVVDQVAIDSAGQPGVWSHLRNVPADGTYVRGTQTGEVFRIAGGAPIYVSTWSAFGGPQPTVDIDQAPIDNAGLGGVWSHLRYVPVDGTLISSTMTGEVYRVAGGAPMYVSTWSALGGPQPTVGVDQAAIANASQLGVWSHLRNFPADGTFIQGAQTGYVFRVAGGAPIYVSTWYAFGSAQPRTVVDEAAIDNAGQAGAWSHLRYFPVDGTFIQGAQTGQVYVVTSGVPSYVPSWAPYGGPRPTTIVDQVAINNAGQNGVWSHLR